MYSEYFLLTIQFVLHILFKLIMIIIDKNALKDVHQTHHNLVMLQIAHA